MPLCLHPLCLTFPLKPSLSLVYKPARQHNSSAAMNLAGYRLRRLGSLARAFGAAAAPRKGLNPTAVALPSSGIRRVMELSWAREAAKPEERVYHLEVGQPDFATPALLVAAAQAALDEGYTAYIPNAGLPELRAAIAARSSEGGGGDGGGAAGRLTAENVVVTPGAVFACATALMACVQPGEEVLLPDPGWCNYGMALEMMGGVGVTYPLCAEHGWLPDPAQVHSY